MQGETKEQRKAEARERWPVYADKAQRATLEALAKVANALRPGRKPLTWTSVGRAFLAHATGLPDVTPGGLNFQAILDEHKRLYGKDLPRQSRKMEKQ